MVFLLTAVGLWKDQQPISGGVVTSGEIVGFERVRPDEGGTPFRFPVVGSSGLHATVHRSVP